ncbi:MAG: Gfo/Idh/MocA family oxidoreductase [Lentisphaeria bacterium]|nr:Gfo/Idh/MocA family oxidoreductase [Lentisphaeria bacterium]
MDTIRIGILGCGPRGMQMAWVTKLIPEYFTLTCMSDPDNNALESAQKNFPEIKLFQSSDELLDSGLADAVITEIPPAIHTEYVVKALERNIHVLGEIPAVNSYEEGCYLWEKVNSAKALYMGGANPNYREKTYFALELKKKGKLENVAYIETSYIHDLSRSKDAWRSTYESCRYCTHSLGPVLKLIESAPKTVSCMSTGDRIGNGCSHNAMTATYQTENGILIRLLTAFSMPYKGPAHTTKIFCKSGIVELYNEKARCWLPADTDPANPQQEDFVEIPLSVNGASRPDRLKIIDEEMFRKASWGHNGSDLFMMQDFADAILNHKPSPVGIREALQMTLPGIYAAESAREGGALKQIKYPWDQTNK